MNTTTAITEGTRVAIDFTQNGETVRHLGTVAGTYVTEFHGFQLPMVSVTCADGRIRHAMLGDVTVLPIERRFVSVLTLPRLGGVGYRDDFAFEGTLADFIQAFGTPEALAIHDHGATEGRNADGDKVLIDWCA